MIEVILVEASKGAAVLMLCILILLVKPLVSSSRQEETNYDCGLNRSSGEHLHELKGELSAIRWLKEETKKRANNR